VSLCVYQHIAGGPRILGGGRRRRRAGSARWDRVSPIPSLPQ